MKCIPRVATARLALPKRNRLTSNALFAGALQPITHLLQSRSKRLQTACRTQRYRPVVCACARAMLAVGHHEGDIEE